MLVPHNSVYHGRQKMERSVEGLQIATPQKVAPSTFGQELGSLITWLLLLAIGLGWIAASVYLIVFFNALVNDPPLAQQMGDTLDSILGKFPY